jgi:hypothetical protein
MKEAEEDFSYSPEPRTLEGVVEWFKLRGHGKPPKQSGGPSSIWNFILKSVVVACIIMLVMNCLPLAT